MLRVYNGNIVNCLSTTSMEIQLTWIQFHVSGRKVSSLIYIEKNIYCPGLI